LASGKSTPFGQAALPQFGDTKGEEVRLVVSDVVMPGMGGIALLHALRERKREIGVVMLTAHMLERERELEQLAKVVARALGTD
jgi:CheY-like chemotaxis protein